MKPRPFPTNRLFGLIMIFIVSVVAGATVKPVLAAVFG